MSKEDPIAAGIAVAALNRGVPAERDRRVRARVRLRRDARTRAMDALRVGRAGQGVVATIGGRGGMPAAMDQWRAEGLAGEALIIATAEAQVMEVLEEISPWPDKVVELVTAAMRADTDELEGAFLPRAAARSARLMDRATARDNRIGLDRPRPVQGERRSPGGHVAGGES